MEVEPIFVSMALYDSREKKKVRARVKLHVVVVGPKRDWEINK